MSSVVLLAPGALLALLAPTARPLQVSTWRKPWLSQHVAVSRAAVSSLMASATTPPSLLADLLADGATQEEQLMALLSLTKMQLKEECATRGLQVSGTKAVLAPRLLSALHPDGKSSDGNRLPLPPPPSPPPPSPPPGVKLVLTSTRPKRATAGPDEIPPLVPTPRYDANGALIDEPGAFGGHEGTGTGTGADLELTVLGSGACNPSPWRGASCSALRVHDGFWLFDVGEGTQVQLQRCSVRPSKIDKIFITHAHGDHCFGLPGLLCLIARGRDKRAPPVEIYGPHGLRAFVRISLVFTGTRMLPPYMVHELHGVPQLPAGRQRSLPPPISAQPVAAPTIDRSGVAWGEIPGSRDILPSDDGTWSLTTAQGNGRDGVGLRISAAPVQHTVPCVGFVIAEEERPGRLQVEKVLPHLERNRDALRATLGLRDPRQLLKRVKQLSPGESLELPDGSRIEADEVLGGARRGRKIVVLGDCSDAEHCIELGRGADLLVHEATNSYLPSFGDSGGLMGHERETRRHGHSTPQMAGRVAAAMGVRKLLLTHFSQRYHPANHAQLNAIAKLAAGCAGLPRDSVACAYDTMAVPVWQPDRQKPVFPEASKGRRSAEEAPAASE